MEGKIKPGAANQQHGQTAQTKTCRRPSSAAGRRKQALAPCQAANISHSAPLLSTLSSHPDAIKRRQKSDARKASSDQDAQMAQSVEWWRGSSSMPTNLILASDPQAFQEAIAQDKLVIVKFFAPWCMACRRLFPALLRLAENNPDVLFVEVNGGDSLLAKFVESLAVDKLPYFHFYRGGNLVSHFAANLTKISMLRAEVAAHKECVLSTLLNQPLFNNSSNEESSLVEN